MVEKVEEEGAAAGKPKPIMPAIMVIGPAATGTAPIRAAAAAAALAAVEALPATEKAGSETTPPVTNCQACRQHHGVGWRIK